MGAANKNWKEMKTRNTSMPVALTIAGSDSGGGAGIQADLKTFAALGVHGTSAISCVTAQTPERVLGIQPCRPEIVRQQIRAVLDEFHPSAVKTGMLYSGPIIRVVVSCFRAHKHLPLIVDPVMVSGRGAPLLVRSAVQVLTRELLPLAALVTPNLAEAQVLSQHAIGSVEEMRRAARAIHRRFGCGALVKGGHLRNAPEAIDIFFDGQEEWLLSAPFVKGIRTHGTGCTYSAAIAAYLAAGCRLFEAVANAKEYISQAIARSTAAGKHSILNSLGAVPDPA
jgi:hydroxymethylpyrimidine/phosphomethylpyrimidine kinase